MAVFAKELSRAVVLFQNANLVAVGTPAVSAYLKAPQRQITITKKHTFGTYTMTLDWSMDGVNSVFTTTPVLVESTPLVVSVLTPWVRFTITATIANFTAHQTTVMI